MHKRGTGIVLGSAKKSKLPVGPVVLGFFIFVVIGSGGTRRVGHLSAMLSNVNFLCFSNHACGPSCVYMIGSMGLSCAFQPASCMYCYDHASPHPCMEGAIEDCCLTAYISCHAFPQR